VTSLLRRIRVGLALLAFWNCGAIPTGAQAAAHVPLVFIPTLAKLRVTTLPVLLPTAFAGARLNDPRRTFVRVSAGAHHYDLEIDYALDCNGANVCSEGSFSASDAAYRKTFDSGQKLEDSMFAGGRRVKLAAAFVGFYSEAVSGASDGGNSYLHFTRGGVRYAIVTRISTQTELVKIANSAIQNGVVRP
jgi:hypothetical protein